MTRYKLRRIIQFVTFMAWLVVLFFIIQGTIPTTHEACPYASVCFGTMAAHSIIVYPITVVIGLLIAISTIIIGRKFCGYICFFGTFQEYVYRLRKGKKKFIHPLPQHIHRLLSPLKYLVFLATIALAWSSMQFIYMKFCPAVAIGHPGRIGLAGISTLVVIVFGGFFIERFWCRYLCPYAALMNIFQLIGRLFRIRRQNIFRNVAQSIQCRNCANYCPMQIDLGDIEEIKDCNCIHCMRCVRQCTKDRTQKSKCIYRDNL
jgi:polyferredoxin